MTKFFLMLSTDGRVVTTSPADSRVLFSRDKSAAFFFPSHIAATRAADVILAKMVDASAGSLSPDVALLVHWT